MQKLTQMLSRAETFKPLLMVLTISTLLLASSGCRSTPEVISSDRTVHFLKVGETYTAPTDGLFMPDALYLEYRKAVADKIQEASAPKK